MVGSSTPLQFMDRFSPLQAPVRVVVELAGVDELLCKHEGLRYKSRAPLQ